MTKSNGVDLRAIAYQAMTDRGFRVDFSSSVQNEIAKAREPDFSSLGIPDLSNLLWSSIDNDDSRDLDQCEYLEAGAGAGDRVYVAIADVSHFVPLGSAVDDAATQNTTSVYTGVVTFPMLPEELSTDLSSLNEGVKRLAIVVQMDIVDGQVTASKVYPAVIKNHAQLTYNGIATFLEEWPEPHSDITRRVLSKVNGIPGLKEQIIAADRIAQSLRARRFDIGALDFRMPELRPEVNEDGTISLGTHETNRATQIIEEFMIASNTTVAAFLDESGVASIQRVVKTPKNWPRIVTLANQYGWRLPSFPDGEALQAFLADQIKKDPDRFPDLSLAIIKLLGRGEYVVKAPEEAGPGHFGLAASNYLHGSAANRRYPDLGDQRVLLNLLAGKESPYTTTELADLAAWCTQREGEAKKVERQVQKSIAAVALMPRIGEMFAGFITGSSDKGVYVRIADPPVEGKVDGKAKGLEVGDSVDVRLVSTDPYKGYIDFEVERKR